MALEDADFSDVGGFESAYFKLIGVADGIIKRRSGRTAGGAAVALMPPDELVDHAFKRYRQEPGVKQGRTVYEQLVAYMDDHAHVVKKSPRQKTRVHLSELQRGETAVSIEQFRDVTSLDPRAALEAQEDAEAAEEEKQAELKLVEDLRREFSKNGVENQIISIWSDGVTKRADAIKRLKVADRDYDSAVKRILRAKTKLINEFAKRK